MESKLARAVDAPVGISVPGRDGENVDDARARPHARGEALSEQEWSGKIDADGLCPFLNRDFGVRFYDRNSGVVDEEIDRLMADLGDQILNAADCGEVVNQLHRLVFCEFAASLSQRDRISAMQQQLYFGGGEAERDGASDSATGAGNEIALHFAARIMRPLFAAK